MKKILLAFLMLGAVGAVNAQIIFFEDFQDVSDIDDVNNLDDMEPENWVLWDVDEIPDSDGDVSNWFLGTGPEHNSFTGSGEFALLDGVEDMTLSGLGIHDWLIEDGVEDTNFVFGSQSWLEGYAEGNRNWLVLPEMTLGLGTEFRFHAAPIQGPRYADGYSVWIATDDYDDIEEYVQLRDIAQTIPPIPAGAGAEVLDPSMGNSLFDDGEIHYNGYDYSMVNVWFHEDGLTFEEATVYVGLLEPISIDLSDYEGETVRLAILHDSDDDNVMYIDNIVVEDMVFTSIDEVSSQYFGIYPNPVEAELNIQFTDKFNGQGVYNIIDAKGSLVSKGAINSSSAATEQIDVAGLETGNYTFMLFTEGVQTLSTNFVKQ